MSRSILEKYKNLSLVRGGVYLYSPSVSKSLLEEARGCGIPLLGIDGVFLTESTTRPSIEDSIDFSLRPSNLESIYDEAVEFIHRRSNLDIYFEIVFGDT